ncbi:BMP family protein [Bordetella petrii]|uniref:BMP family protein n=1 Tax=Bordetella petrii TaxID=94624 RepID=UPI001E4C3F90|nr:BMP family protein [Bordetella petrii]MCD0505519.1 BMP family protein [Bordetella petrii]
MTFRISPPSAASARRRTLLRLGVALGALMAGKAYARAPAKIKVVGVYTVPIGQQWVSRVHKALVLAETRGDIDYRYAENVSHDYYERVLRKHAEEGAQLIVGEAFRAEEAARRVARAYPQVGFLMGSSGRPQLPNFSVFDNYIQEPAYLTGMIAGGLSESGKIGLVGGYPIPEVNRLMHAFMDGVREVNPDAEFRVAFIGSWFDPPKARKAALAMIDQGVDVLYAERFGVAEAAQERGKLAIGNVIDTQPQYPDTVVASALWDMGPTIDRALTMVQRGTFKADDYGKYSQMRYEGSMLSPLGTFEGKLPGGLIASIEARKKTILDGSFSVKINDSPPRSSVP